MSSFVTLFSAIKRESTSGTRVVAKRKTSLPFMPIVPYAPKLPVWPPPRSIGVALLGRPKLHLPVPSLPSSKPSRQSSSGLVAWMTTAPAPSPKRTQVPLSVQSTHLARQSAPMMTAFFTEPLRKNCEAVTIAKTKPEQAAVMSKATAFFAPSWAAISVALPKRSSGVDVARMTSPMSSAGMLAFSRARLAASAEMDSRDSSGPSTWRRRMPVRCEIHSSLVSRMSVRSSLVTQVFGAQDPVPMILMPAAWAQS
mmetsp:Transcript_42095/g.91741  ORF Transcript_42095/g.91741 Transcript_42095/m.91741 type:complete len:254 (+) Transcript_42095:708-1469(+)